MSITPQPTDSLVSNPSIDDAEDGERWMKLTLLLAGIYNLLWGAWVIFRPMDLFDWTGIPRPSYVGIWQCVGMIVGVYGVGYLAAARHPLRHWPVVLVGLLGKVFGPIGMVSTFLTTAPGDAGYLPVTWLWVNVFNDLIWILPFASILYASFRLHSAPRALYDSETLSLRQSNERFVTNHGRSIAQLSKDGPVLLLFLRHSGCTFCKEALADLSAQRASIEAAGNKIVLVHMSDSAKFDKVLDRYGLTGIEHITDTSCLLYRTYELERGRFSQMFGMRVWFRGFAAGILKRHGVGSLDGDGFQMPGLFIVEDSKIVKAYRHESVADRPDYGDFCVA